MLKWKKTGRIVNEDGSFATVYEAGRYRVESRKMLIPRANGFGCWQHTSYFLIVDSKEKEFHRLQDAKEAAEKMEAEREKKG